MHVISIYAYLLSFSLYSGGSTVKEEMNSTCSIQKHLVGQ